MNHRLTSGCDSAARLKKHENFSIYNVDILNKTGDAE
jgi:hypothetical protein